MILVDTSVWIDFFRGRATPQVDALCQALENEDSVAFTGVILQELLQGCRTDAEADLVEERFSPFIEIFPRRTTYRLAARLFRDCRRQGLTIRSSLDCLIAACAIETASPVLERDRDFRALSQVSGLELSFS